ncbi:MAG: hypothetical protein CSA96_07845 [Bacteroidetes bacterium]|nr:MAG: hypothetical protein CSA96_07845 [Bacteroidota bacterium]
MALFFFALYLCMHFPEPCRPFPVLLILLTVSCSPDREGMKPASRFTLIKAEESGIDFINRVSYTEAYNTYTYRNFYNGAGVGVGDFNRDGLYDIYFCGNIEDNRLYLNEGGFQFRDITTEAGVACAGAWSTGVSIADVNGDGWPDIFVCKSGIPDVPHRKNELFLNNGNLSFTECAEAWGIADLGLSTHASFFDYDLDGDLDLYLLNNSFESVSDFDMQVGAREQRDPLGANKLYRNEGDHFVDATVEAGIYSSKIGFGLGVSVADINRDGWPDIYVSNDFFERDYLYINQQNGSFRECLTGQVPETSLGAMGADVADINNDAFPDIFVTEMTAEGNRRLKTKVLFEDWARYQDKLNKGYHRQFARNVLQLNNGNGQFSEIGRYSGVSFTDWSWGALIMDLDNDGWKDLFVANGIFKDLLDRDYLEMTSDPAIMRARIAREEQAILGIIDDIPSEAVPNYAFRNNRDLSFSNQSAAWGLATPSFSNGAAYGDLDNDGDLDLVVNNVNMPPFLYRNETQKEPGSNYLTLALSGEGMNSGAIGSALTLYAGGELRYQELIPARGFKSSMDPRIHFGLGAKSLVDSLIVNWPDGRISRLCNLAANQILHLDIAGASHPQAGQTALTGQSPDLHATQVFSKVKAPPGLLHVDMENEFDDFRRDALLFQMISNEGPHCAQADVNGDGLRDLFICGSKDEASRLYMQEPGGHFRPASEALFAADATAEDSDCAFFDADGDGDSDLYVCSGSNEFPSSASALADRLYINDGRGKFSRSPLIFPAGRYSSSSCVAPADFDGDGDIDLFVGSRLRPFLYGVPARGYLLENDGRGTFSDATASRAPELKEPGMITDISWSDVDDDGDPDLVLAGEWMPLKLFINEAGTLREASAGAGLAGSEGWWTCIESADLNADGLPDFVVGNHGLNSRFKASADKPLLLYVNDFDLNGSVEHILCGYFGDSIHPLPMKDDLIRQIPALAEKLSSFDAYKDLHIEDLFAPEVLQRSVILRANMLESVALLNLGGGRFRIQALPREAQFFPVYAIQATDFDGDGLCDLLLGGNQSRAKPETGSYLAGYGLYLQGEGNGRFGPLKADRSGLLVEGEIRDFLILEVGKDSLLSIIRNNDTIQYYRY